MPEEPAKSTDASGTMAARPGEPPGAPAGMGRLRMTSQIAGVIATVVGTVALVEFAWERASSAGGPPMAPLMHPLVALAFVLAGACLWRHTTDDAARAEPLAASRPTGPPSRVGPWLARFVVLIGIVIFSASLLVRALGIDEFLEAGGRLEDHSLHLESIEPGIGACLALIGLGLSMLVSRRPRRPSTFPFVVSLGSFVAVSGILALFGHLAHFDREDAWSSLANIGTPTAAALIAIGGGLLVAGWRGVREQWALGKWGTSGFAIGMGLQFVLLVLTHIHAGNMAASVEGVSHTQEVRFHLSELRSSLQDLEIGSRSYLLTSNDTYYSTFQIAQMKIKVESKVVRDLIADKPDQQRRFRAVERLIDVRVALAAQTVATHERAEFSDATDLVRSGQGTDLMGQISRQIAAMDAVESRLAEQRRTEANLASDLAFAILPSGGLLSLASLAAVMLLLNREVSAHRRSEAEVLALNLGLEQRVSDRTAELALANKELEAFAYSVSHDLRAPLRSIDGFSRIALTQHAGELSPETREALELVRSNAQQMGRLIDDLLVFSRLSRQPLNKVTVATVGLVRECWETLHPETEGRHVEFTVGPLPDCAADPGLLKLVWTNLLGNALKFTRPRDPARIEVGARREQTPVYFVRDNGVGFKMAYAHKLFGVFQRLHRAEDFPGTGVGLATAQRIVHRHGGRIWAEAELDRGATFFFTLSPEKPL